MAESESRAAAANVVDGFSKRFNYLMDRARFPKENRISEGARRFDVVPNTFKNWCVANKIPGNYSVLVQVVRELLREIPGTYNHKAVVAWLLAGDAVPNPFADDTDALALVQLYLQIRDVAEREGMEFDKLPRDVRNVILRRARAMLPAKARSNDGDLQLDQASLNVVLSMLDTARTMG